MIKTIFILLFLYTGLFSDSINEDAPFMTKQMLDDDLDTPEYQLFVNKTNNISIKNLTPKIIFSGDMDDYYEFFKTDMIKNMNISTQTLSVATSAAYQGVLNSSAVEEAIAGSSFNTSGAFQNAGLYFGAALIMQPIATALFGDDNYIQVIDYFDNDMPKTRVFKYIVSDESIPKDELEIIFNSSEEKSYHFNRGKCASTFNIKDYRVYRKTHNREQK